MKLPPISGFIHKVGKVNKVSKGFAQSVIITQPAQKNEQGYTLSKEQFFVIHIWSNKADDSRFPTPDSATRACKVEVYLDGQRWEGRNGFEYNNKLNLDKWVNEEPENKKS